MLAFVEPLDRVREATRWFVAAPELRLLHVHVGPDIRLAALKEIAAREASPENRSLFVLSDSPVAAGAPDWEARATQVDECLADRRAQAAEHGIVIPAPMQPPPDSRGLERFARCLRGHLDTFPASVSGVVVVLAPSAFEGDAAVWLSDLQRLLSSAGLSRARFIVVETDPAPARNLGVELADRAELVDARTSAARSRDALQLMLAGMKTAPRGAEAARLAGMAGPREAPPPRRNATGAPDPSLVAAELEGAKLSPSAANPEVMQALRIELLSASLAQQDGRSHEAVEHQARARDIAARAGLTEQAALFDLMLGGHLIQAGSFGAAARQFDKVIENARAASLPKLEAQAHMAKGGTLLARQRPYEAAEAYAEGGSVAEKSGERSIAIECFRMVGQVLLGVGNEAEAGTALRRALQIAEQTPRADAALTSAPLAAKELASVYRRHGMHAQAASLEAQADDWEAVLREAASQDGGVHSTAPPPRAGEPDGANGSGSAS